MRVLITGITGRIGENLANSVVSAGHLARGPVWARDRRTEKVAGRNVGLVEGSLTQRTMSGRLWMVWRLSATLDTHSIQGLAPT